MITALQGPTKTMRSHTADWRRFSKLLGSQASSTRPLSSRVRMPTYVDTWLDFTGFNLTCFVQVLKEEFKQHFRNVSRIMDCVGCDKCRLWGKIQTTGLGTALKVLFELDEKNLE
jgi:hypothetical protein